MTQQGARRATSWCWCASAGALFEAIIRSLKDEGVAGRGRRPAGARPSNIAVMDLMVLADAAAAALTTILRWRPRSRARCSASTTMHLFAIAWKREGSLRAALRAHERVATSSKPRERPDRYAEWAQRETTVQRSIARVLGPEDGRRRRFLSAARPEADDAHRRIPEPRARLRARARRLAAGLRCLAAHRHRPMHEARHGDRARRGAGDDRAWRQGPRSADRGPGRQHTLLRPGCRIVSRSS